MHHMQVSLIRLIWTLFTFSFGYCGSGEGYCTKPTTPRPTLPTTPRPSEPTRTNSTVQTAVEVTEQDFALKNVSVKSSSGCFLEAKEIVGGDLPFLSGGGGVNVRGGDASGCLKM